MKPHPTEHRPKLVFKIFGSNDLGADVGSLTLYTDGKPSLVSQGFSGGIRSEVHSAPLPSGHCRVRLDIRQIVTRVTEPANSGMHHWYGIEKIDAEGWQWEWGHFRAAPNEPDPKLPQAFRGNFLHGKVRPGDYTHGCICERSEVILRHLWSMASGSVDVEVQR